MNTPTQEPHVVLLAIFGAVFLGALMALVYFAGTFTGAI